MADLVKRGGGLVLALAAWVAQAQVLPDPTRPPGNLMMAGESTATAAPAGNRVQSIMLRTGAKPQALVNGEWREPGQKVGEIKVIKINADRVIINGPQGRETLLLSPDVSIKTARPAGDKAKNQGKRP